MYLAHFGLFQPPFKITAHTDFFYAGGNRGAVLDALIYAIRNGEGIVKISGEVGTGKTMLCRMLQERLPEEVETVYLANPSVSPDEILHAIAFEMQLSLPREASRLEVLQALQDYLLERHAQGKQVVVFVEEAQSMPLATLEEIRLLSNLETRQYKLLQIALFGQPELDTHLALPEIRQLKERITHSFTLKPLTAPEIRDYLMFRMRAANYHGPDLFSHEGIKLIARASQGLTRRVNIIADKILLAAFSENTHTLTTKHARAAILDSDYELATPAWDWRKLAAGVALLAVGIVVGVAIHAGMQAAPDKAKPVAPASPRQGLPTKPDATPPVSTPAAPLPAAAPAPAPVVLDVVEQRLAATLKWLDAEPPDTSSMQLMVAHDMQNLRQRLEKIGRQVEIDKIYVYRTQAGGRAAWAVLYGSYPSRKELYIAMQQLPASLKSYSPYLRTVQGIRAEIGSFHDEAINDAK
ncbi:MAG: AAA family ATPase [Sulfuricellaceae bacterium]|nr:AAA family ATPase [Sulfuricellaceae bacterium]